MKLRQIGTILALFVCAGVRGENLIVSTHDINANADNVITAYEANSDILAFLAVFVKYSNGLYEEANQARKDGDNAKYLTLLVVSHFNARLAHQVVVDNKRDIPNYDAVELGTRQVTDATRSELLSRFRLGKDSSLLAQALKDYRESFGHRKELILRIGF